jgi:DNA modification methylase|tara:strand:+ start:875 stop:2113 length:1239 start_codon:yes stop_codon:yes gene_type:complete
MNLNIEYVKRDQLIPYINNSRTHDARQVKQIASSIKEFGFTNPLLIDEDGGIIAGHGRLLAADLLGIDQVPTITLVGLTEAQRKAYVIADNQLALNAGWDLDTLKVELDRLTELDFDVDLLGFDDDFLSSFLDEPSEGLTDEDAVPDAPENPVTVEGDVWILGNHRLMCGDSTSIDAVDRLMDGQKADMVFTDPPYGMSYGGGRAGKIGSTDGTVKKHGVILGDTFKGNDLIGMIRDAVGSAVTVSKSGSSKYICFPWRTYSEFEEALAQIDLTPTACIVWDKKSIGLGNANYRPQHEFIFYAKGENWHGDKAQSDVWYMSRGATGQYVHPTQKPVELIEKAINNSSKGQDVVIDVFGGSGSTLIACEKTNRYCRMMELDPKYCDVIVKRWEEFTGKEAVLESSGKTYSEAA